MSAGGVAIPAEETAPATRTLPADSWKRLRDFLVHAIGQVRILQRAYPGIMHALIFWGVTIQVLGTAINLMQMQLFIPLVELPIPRGNLYLAYELVMDLAGVAILLGVLLAAFRRVVLRPSTLDTSPGDVYALVLLGLIPLVGFSLEGTRLLSSAPPWAAWSPAGIQVAGLLRAVGLSPLEAANLHAYLFWTHAALGLTLLASIPFTKLRHLIQAPLNILLHSRRPVGELEMIADIEDAEILGVGRVEEFSSAQLLAFDACVRCGRCLQVCPAVLSGAHYSPRDLIQNLRQSMVDNLLNPNGHTSELFDTAVAPDSVWACTTCGACQADCPVFINPIDEVVDLRRYLALTTGKLPKAVADTLRNLERQGNPWGLPPDDREAWVGELDIRILEPGESTEVLLFVGCAGAFDARNQQVTRALVSLLQTAGVDFAILGAMEGCCGETARRLGHEYLFQVFAEQNIEMFREIHFERILTACPHCFNTLQNEYPQFGADFNVQHYSQYLCELQNAGRLPRLEPGHTSANGQPSYTYHDSCYLGRYNQVYQAPRQLLGNGSRDLVEMRRNSRNSLCCGGGGGGMWLEVESETRINHLRLEDALATHASTIATACPYCLVMFDDALRTRGLSDQVAVKDITEILVDKLAAPTEAAKERVT